MGMTTALQAGTNRKRETDPEGYRADRQKGMGSKAQAQLRGRISALVRQANRQKRMGQPHKAAATTKEADRLRVELAALITREKEASMTTAAALPGRPLSATGLAEVTKSELVSTMQLRKGFYGPHDAEERADRTTDVRQAREDVQIAKIVLARAEERLARAERGLAADIKEDEYHALEAQCVIAAVALVQFERETASPVRG